MKTEKRKKFVCTLLTLLFGSFLFASQNDLIKIIDLKGQWKYSIGERKEWIVPGYDDNSWTTIHVPSAWEDQGFYGYNGFGFYRKSFALSNEHKGKTLYLNLGYVDDVDETYFNGHKIGSTGSFPPSYITAYK